MVIDRGTANLLRTLFHEVQGESVVETLAYVVRFAYLLENRDDLTSYIKSHHWDGTVRRKVRDIMLGLKSEDEMDARVTVAAAVAARTIKEEN